MADRVFVCGDGYLIRPAAIYLLRASKEVTVVSHDRSLAVEGAAFVEGDPTRTETLAKAGVERADQVLVIARQDWDAAFIVMNSRKLNREAFIVANVSKETSAQKLYSVGASRVVFSLAISGQLIASSAASPVLAEFMDRIILTHDIEIGHLEVDARSKLAGRQLSELGIREETGCWVLGLIDEGSKFRPNPLPETRVSEGQTLICLGSSEGLRNLFERAKPGS